MKKDRFEKIYEEHAPGLLGFLVYRTGNRALAEDILADTFERVLRSRKRYDPRRGNAKSWVYAIALNRLRDQKRRQESEKRALERTTAGTAAEAPEIEMAGERRDLLQALACLSREEREALALRYGADLSVPEIAEVLDVKLSTAEGRVYRGLDKLRELLEG